MRYETAKDKLWISHEPVDEVHRTGYAAVFILLKNG